jgi:nitrate reductase gamma subunit
MLIILSYLALAAFIIGVIYKGLQIKRMPVHLRWELAPVPHEKGKASYGGSYFEEYEWWTKPREVSKLNEMWYMFQEIILLKGVWEHKRSLWYFSFPFHFGGLYLMGGAIALWLLIAIMSLTAISSAPVEGLATFFAGLAYLLGGVGVVGLLARRIFDQDIKPFTTFASIFNLAFLFMIYASGMYAMMSTPDFTRQMAGFMQGMMTFNTSVSLPAAASLHVVLGTLFLIYLPFTYMMHFVAKYFTYHEVRWNDEPMEAGSKMEKEVTELLGQKVTWDAPHIKGEGKKTWVDVATEEVKK